MKAMVKTIEDAPVCMCVLSLCVMWKSTRPQLSTLKFQFDELPRRVMDSRKCDIECGKLKLARRMR